MGALLHTVLAVDPAFERTFGLVLVFGGIGVVVNLILVYVAVQIRNEREENRRYLASKMRAGGSEEPPSS